MYFPDSAYAYVCRRVCLRHCRTGADHPWTLRRDQGGTKLKGPQVVVSDYLHTYRL